MVKICLHLPYPVSVNKIWRGGRQGKVYRSPSYRSWMLSAGMELLAQKSKLSPKNIAGEYSLFVVLNPPDSRRRDLDNTLKVLQDLLVSQGIVQDDSLCEKLYARWGTAQEAPLGALVIVKSCAARKSRSQK